MNISSGSDDNNTLTLKVGFEGSGSSSQGVGAKEMARAIGELSHGTIALELYPDALLGGGPAMIAMVQNGDLDIFFGGAGYFSSLDSRLNVFDIPYLFETVEQAYGVLDSQLGREMLDVLETQQLKGLSFWENGIRSITNNRKPVTHPDDFKGLKIRTMPGNLSHEALWQQVGMETLPLPSGAICQAILDGKIDSQEHPVSVIYARKFFEVQKYLSFTRHLYGPLIQVMNLAKFNALSEEQQAILLKGSYAGAVATRTFSNSNEARFLEEMIQAGLQVNEVDPQLFKAVMRPALEKDYVEKNGDVWLKKISAILAG